MKVTIIDNYDSFTYNLAHLFKALGAGINVVRNDKFQLDDLEDTDKLVLSPGPGIPDEAGLTLQVIHHYAGRKPILGVCLGHQAIGQSFGARLVNLPDVYHGVQTSAHIVKRDYIFDRLPDSILVGRYHSWAVDTEDLPPVLEVTAVSDDGRIMALRHKTYDIRGIQFHPESILTPDGRTMIENWLNH